MARSNSYSSCFPCEGPAASPTASSAMQKCGDVAKLNPEGSGTLESQFKPQRQHQQQQQTGPTINDVGALVAKAKKAAVSLWMILHAQNCRQTDGTCPHRGCPETKLLLTHVKTCPAGPDFRCPTRCKGCNETRKLLAHYRRCKDMRMKQVGLGRRSGLQPDQSCLVCSLMARYAKSVMDRTNKNCISQGKNNHVASLRSSSPDGKFNVGKGLATFPEKETVVSTVKNPKRTPSMTLMPPPPPRCRSTPASPTVELGLAQASSGTPPSPSQFDAIAAMSHVSDPSLLSKSVDSNVRIPFPILRHSRKVVEAADDEMVVPGPVHATFARRQRAESYDEQKTHVVKFAPTIITSKQYYSDGHNEEQPMPPSQNGNNARPRSVSLGCNNSNVTLLSTHEGDSIAENGVEKVSIFPMD